MIPLDPIIFAGLLLASVVLHELSHGAVARLLGDPTAQKAGRLTLNPLKHIDPLWTVIVPGLLYLSTGGRFAIGMAKPVPVNFSRLKPRKLGMMAVAFAGPATNLLLAALLSRIWQVTGREVFLYGAYLNLGLCVFNLIPIPPLDGSRILFAFFPDLVTERIFKFERLSYLIILILYFTGILMRIVLPGISYFSRLLKIPQLEMIS